MISRRKKNRSVDIRVCVECGCAGMHAWNASLRKYEVRAQKEMTSAVQSVTSTGSMSGNIENLLSEYPPVNCRRYYTMIQCYI